MEEESSKKDQLPWPYWFDCASQEHMPSKRGEGPNRKRVWYSQWHKNRENLMNSKKGEYNER
jgi:hypothetical protein